MGRPYAAAMILFQGFRFLFPVQVLVEQLRLQAILLLLLPPLPPTTMSVAAEACWWNLAPLFQTALICISLSLFL